MGLTFAQIANQLGKDEVWVAAAFYGQVNPRLRAFLFSLRSYHVFRPNSRSRRSGSFPTFLGWFSLTLEASGGQPAG